MIFVVVCFDFSVQFMGLLLVEVKMVLLNALICAKNLLSVELALLLLLMMLIKYVQLTAIQSLHVFEDIKIFLTIYHTPFM